MKSETEIREQLVRLEADVRHRQPKADVQINVVLALIQTEIDSKITALKWVLQQE